MITHQLRIVLANNSLPGLPDTHVIGKNMHPAISQSMARLTILRLVKREREEKHHSQGLGEEKHGYICNRLFISCLVTSGNGEMQGGVVREVPFLKGGQQNEC